MINRFGTSAFARYLIAGVLIIAFTGASPANQKNQKNKKDQASPAADASGSVLTSAISTQIDQAIGEMLGAFQLGDVETMHKHYADNATFVSGSYAPPVVGWQNYVPIYQSGMSGFQGIQLIRRNTYVYNTARRRLGYVPVGISLDVQWEAVFSGRTNDTLIFDKVGDKWLIVHNHTSQVIPPAAAALLAQSATPPAAWAEPARYGTAPNS